MTAPDLPPPRPFTRADADEWRSHGTWLGDSIADAIDARLDAETAGRRRKRAERRVAA